MNYDKGNVPSHDTAQEDTARGSDPAAVARRNGATRRRTRVRAAVATTAALGIAAAIVAVGDRASQGSPATGGYLPGQHTVYSGHAGDAVIHDGDRVTGSGQVVAPPGEPVRFCAPVAIPADLVLGPYDPDRNCPVYITITGVDLNALTDRTVKDGVIIGSATLTGMYHGDSMTVTSQHRPADQPEGFDHAPCDAPAGGWPANGDEMGNLDFDAVDAYQREHPNDIVDTGQLNLSDHQHVMYVETTGDPGAARSELEKFYGDALCVVQAKYSTTELDRANAMINARMSGGAALTSPSVGGGIGYGPDEHSISSVEVPVLSEEFAKAIDGQTAGIIQVDVWLVPAG